MIRNKTMDVRKMNRLWITGYRSYELNVFNEKDPKVQVIKHTFKKNLIARLENNQLDWIITGGNLGVEQWAIEVALELKSDYNFKLAMMIPFENFETNWKEDKQLTFQQLKSKVDFFATTSNQPYQNFMQLKNYQHFMLEHTDAALLIYDTDHPGKPKYDFDLIENYQETNNYELNLIDFYDLEDSGNELDEMRNFNKN